MKSKKKALITGISGQDGAYLASYLLSKNYDVDGILRRSSLDNRYRLKILGIEDKVNLMSIDLTEQNSISILIKDKNYDEIYNLAAQSFVGDSWSQPVYTTNVNSLGPLYILDAVKNFSQSSKFYQASTSEMYGLVQEIPQTETTKLYPRSPYGVSKTFSHFLTINYRESYDLFCLSGILFNHESPLRGEEFVTKKIAKHFTEIKFGNREKLKIGNLDAKRDWGFAKEYVEGMWLMLQHEIPQEFVLSTGKQETVRNFISKVSEALDYELIWEGKGVFEKGIEKKTGKILVEVDPNFFRPSEVEDLLGDSSKAKELLSWSAKTDASELAKIMVDFEIDTIKKTL